MKLKNIKSIQGLKGAKVDNFTFLTNKRKSSPSYWVQWWRKKKEGQRVMINLELENGMHRIFLVLVSEGGFKYDKKQYLLDDESKYYNVENNIYCYDYHEAVSIPIKRNIDSDALIQAVENDTDIDVEYAINPLTIKRFAVSKIAEGIMKGQAIDSALKMLTYICIIGAMSSFFMLMLFMFKTGMFDSIKGGII